MNPNLFQFITIENSIAAAATVHILDFYLYYLFKLRL